LQKKTSWLAMVVDRLSVCCVHPFPRWLLLVFFLAVLNFMGKVRLCDCDVFSNHNGKYSYIRIGIKVMYVKIGT
jgi:hypothetical protein